MIIFNPEYTIQIQNKNHLNKISSKKVGIDIGQTLTKIAYLDKNELLLFVQPSDNINQKLYQFLIEKGLDDRSINITGGKGFRFNLEIRNEYSSDLFNEFQANVVGIQFLYFLRKHKELPVCLIVTLGTGTSIVISKKEYEHIGGSALGGGFYMALIHLLFKIKDYGNSIILSERGNRYNVDLKVADIYADQDPRVNDLFRQFTAASLGKISEAKNIGNMKEDILNSLICMIGENVGTIAIEKAKLKKLQRIIFCGGFVDNNPVLRRTLKLLCNYNNMKSIFLKQTLFAGAIGLLLL